MQTNEYSDDVVFSDICNGAKARIWLRGGAVLIGRVADVDATGRCLRIIDREPPYGAITVRFEAVDAIEVAP